jgi:hypothetical protein
VGVNGEGTDLIYEGITTTGCRFELQRRLQHEGTDLIYEGITTIVFDAFSNPSRKELT